MRQIRLDEMTNRRKVQYAQSKKKRADREHVSIYVAMIICFIILITCVCVLPSNDLPALILLVAVTIVFVLVKYRKYHKIMDMYDAIMQERVWEGYIDDFQFEKEMEFIDKNNQTTQKMFSGEEYKEFVNVERIHVIYIARLDRWYLEKEE